MNDVTLVDVMPVQSPDLLANGTVDAVVTWQPYVWRIEKGMGSRAAVWPAQSRQEAYCCAVSTDNWTEGHPISLVKFIRLLSRAEKYLIHHPDEASAIVQKELNYDNGFIMSIWPHHQFSLTLDQSLILAMEDEGRRMINNNLTNERSIPDFRKYLYTKGLLEVEPESVRIIG